MMEADVVSIDETPDIIKDFFSPMQSTSFPQNPQVIATLKKVSDKTKLVIHTACINLRSSIPFY